MILILLTWIYIFALFFVQGEWIKSLFFKNKNIYIGEVILLGMIFQLVTATSWAFFYRINIEYFCINTALTIILSFFRRKSLFSQWKERKERHWDIFSICLFVTIVFLALMRSSLLPFVVDNDSYYVQTIQWINEYGWVKGLANFHIFLAHGSPWHALQAAFNFNFIAPGVFNDINGFLVCILSLLWVQKINDLRKNDVNPTLNWLYFLPVFFVLWFQFVDAPSADLPCFLIGLLIFYHVLNKTEMSDVFVVLLSVILIFVKLNLLPFAFLAIISLNKKNWKFALIFSILIGCIFIAKNLVLTGYPLFPFTKIKSGLTWEIPEKMEAIVSYDNFNFKNIRSNSKLDLLFFAGIIASYLIYSIVAFRERTQRYLWIVFTLTILLVFTTHPQPRYALAVVFYPIAYILSKSGFLVKIMSKGGVFAFLLIALFPIFIPKGLEKLSKNDNFYRTDAFKISYISKPAPITKYPEMQYKKEICTNFEYYAPVDNSPFLYLTASGPLPCAKTNYLLYMHKRTKCLPILRGKGLGDGFESVVFEK